jgi:hypothetical protein
MFFCRMPTIPSQHEDILPKLLSSSEKQGKGNFQSLLKPCFMTINFIKPKPTWLLAFFILIFGSNKIFGQAANIDQIRNGTLGVYSTTPAADWVNGNAGPSNAHFAEGYSIPYRVNVTGLVGTSSTVHHLIVEWDTKQSNGHAIDYITHYQNLDNPTGSHFVTFGHNAEVVDPTMGTTFSGAPTLFQIPTPSSAGSEVTGQPTTSFNNLPTSGYTSNANITKLAVWGGSILSLTYVFENSPDAATASTQTRLDIAFTSADGATALFAWGGHIAAEYDWGVGRGATGVSGSPYHTRIITIDGKPGNQDRSLKATAVIIPPPTCGISAAQLACPETSFLTFSATGSSTGSNVTYAWTLTNGSTSAGARIDPATGNTSFTVKVIPIGTAFIAGGTFSLSLTVNKTGASSTTCSRSPAGTIQKVVATANASPTTIDITSSAHSTTLTADIGAGSTDLDNSHYGYQWTIVTSGTTGTLTNATSRIATYTAGVGDQAATIQFRVVATQTSSPNCSNSATTSVTVNSVGSCSVSSHAPVCQGTSVTHTGAPSPKPSTATYTWSLQGYGGSGTTSSTFTTANGGTSITVNASQSYRIVLSEVYENTAVNTSCYQDVQVDPTPGLQTQYVAPTSCTDQFFEVNVVNPTVGFTYTIKQSNTKSFTAITPTAGSPTVQFTGLVPGDGYLVRVTSSLAGCGASDNCGSVSTTTTNKVTTDANVLAPNNSPVQVDEGRLSKNIETYSMVVPSPTKISALPNPYNDHVRFNMVSGISGYGSLTLYDIVGQKVAVVYQGYIQAGKEFVKDYSVIKNRTSTLIYVFQVGDQRVTGKLIGK